MHKLHECAVSVDYRGFSRNIPTHSCGVSPVLVKAASGNPEAASSVKRTG
jgi:hypothetical protein